MKTTSINAAATFDQVSLTFAWSGTKGYINKLTENNTRSFAWNGGAMPCCSPCRCMLTA